MAYYNDSSEDEKAVDPNAQPNQPGQQSGSVISGQGASGASGPTTPTPAAAAPTPASADVGTPQGSSNTSPFVGIKQYIDANKSQSAKLAHDTAGIVDQASQQARDTLPKQTDLYNQAVNQNTVNLDQAIFDEAKTKAQNVASDAAKKQSFINMRDAQYKGPTDLKSSEFYQPVDQAYQKADTAAKNTLTEEGQGQLLTDLQQQTRGKVNQSAVNLDRLLLRGDEAKNTLAESVKNQADLQPLLQAAQDQSLAKANEGRSITDATRNQIQSTFAGKNSIQEQLKNQISDRVQQITAQGNKQADTLKKLLAAGKTPSSADLKVLGITSKDFQNLQSQIKSYENIKSQAQAEYDAEMKIVNDMKNLGYNTKIEDIGGQEFDAVRNLKSLNDLSKYVTVSNGVNQNNAATAEEFARYGALNDLMGTTNNYLTDAKQAGTANSDFINFDIGKASKSIQDAVATAQKSLDQAWATYNKTQAATKQKQKDSNYANEEKGGAAAGAIIGGSIGGPAGAVVGATIGSAAAHGMGRALCFVKDTPILMADGSYKLVQDLKIGDDTAIGGKVIFHGTGMTDSLVEYKGLYTSPSHAIFDGESWVRADELADGMFVDNNMLDAPEGGVAVYPVSTEFHRLVSNNGVLYADYEELDASSNLTDEEIIVLMNKSVALGADKLCHENLQKIANNGLFAEEGTN